MLQICVHQCRNPAGSRLRAHVCPAGHTWTRPPEASLWAPLSAVRFPQTPKQSTEFFPEAIIVTHIFRGLAENYNPEGYRFMVKAIQTIFAVKSAKELSTF